MKFYTFTQIFLYTKAINFKLSHSRVYNFKYNKIDCFF